MAHSTHWTIKVLRERLHAATEALKFFAGETPWEDGRGLPGEDDYRRIYAEQALKRITAEFPPEPDDTEGPPIRGVPPEGFDDSITYTAPRG